jgi:hypothetical protein
VFRPSDSQIVTSYATFGNCDRKRNATGVFSVSCDKLGNENEEGLIFNFYVRGPWAEQSFTAREIAARMQEDPAYLSGFTAPDPQTGALAYFLIMSSAGDRQGGQAYVVKVAPLGDGVYSLLHTRKFEEPAERVPEMIRTWLAETLRRGDNPTSAIEPSEEWLSLARGER